MERYTSHEGVEKKNQFTKLRRQLKDKVRKGEEISEDLTEMLYNLDDWLSVNYSGWRRNYPEHSGMKGGEEDEK